MATGDSADILGRIKRLIPSGWFKFTAPLRDAVLGGLSDALAAEYAFLTYAKAQTRIATATDFWLDIISGDFLAHTLPRHQGEVDGAYSARIRREILRARVTRAGVAQALTDLTGKAPLMYEPFNTGDCGGWSSRNVATPGYAAWGTRTGTGTGIGSYVIGGFGVGTSSNPQFGAGLWGSRNIPATALITVYRPGAQGVPGVGGWASRTVSQFGSLGAWSSRTSDATSSMGSIAFVSRNEFTGAVSDQDIYDCINVNKPVGVGVYARLV